MTFVASRQMAEVEEVFREAYGQAVSSLVRVFGDITLAEDAVQEAFVLASDRWARDGIPPNPAGWIVTTARNKAIDHVRRSARGREACRPRARPGAGCWCCCRCWAVSSQGCS